MIKSRKEFNDTYWHVHLNNKKNIDDEYKNGLIRKCNRLLEYLADNYPYGNPSELGDQLKNKVHNELEKLYENNGEIISDKKSSCSH
jgi:hypothetical protein